MTKYEQLVFVEDMMRNVRDSIVSKLPNVPETWDGHELRQWISDHVRETVPMPLKGRRQREYKNEVLVRNL